MPLSPDDVQNKRFTVVRFGKSGYDEEEVDAFLDEVEAEMRRLLAEGGVPRDAAAVAPPIPAVPAPLAAPVVDAAPPPPPPPAAPAAPVAPVAEPNETALRTLALAQRTADELTSEAKTEADRLVGAAKLRATALEEEAKTTHAATMSDLQLRRGKIESEIASLRTYEREYRTRLRAYLEGQLSDLEQLTILAEGAPGAPSSATAPPRTAPPPAGASSAPGSPPGPPAGAGATVAGSGPFSSAPAPATGLFASAAPSGPMIGSPPRSIDTDVDASSDVPSSPPVEAEGTDTVSG
jgi:DivIVA domain-containing protein